MTETMGMRRWHSRSPENGVQPATHDMLHGALRANPTPEEVFRFALASTGHRYDIECPFHLVRDGEEARLTVLLGSQKYPPPLTVPADAVARQHCHIPKPKRRVAEGEHHRLRP